MKAQLHAACLVVAAMLMVPATARADVQLTISGGRVWLKASGATVGQILREWSRLGQTRIVNGDQVPGGPVTVQLDNVSEEEALDFLLRSAAGYMGIRRTLPLTAASEFDRILILPRGTAAPPSSATPPRPVFMPPPPVFAEPEPEPSPSFSPGTPGVQRVLGVDGQPVPDDQEDGPRPQKPLMPASPEAPFGKPPASMGSPTPGVPVPGMTVPAPRPPNENQQ